MSDGEEPEVRYLGDVQRLALAPDDVVVVKSEAHLTMEMCSHIRRMLEETLGPERKVMILSGGLEIGVLAPTGGEEG